MLWLWELYISYIIIMGSNICSPQPQSQPQKHSNLFQSSLKYHSTVLDPISSSKINLYTYKQIFLQKKQYKIMTKFQLQSLSRLMSLCVSCPTAVQSIMKYSTEKTLSQCQNNYTFIVYAEHLNFSFREHLENLRFKGVWLSQREILYVVREIVIAGKYLWDRGYKVRSFDPSALYLSTGYEIKIPFQHITPDDPTLPLIPTDLTPTYLSPQQLNPQKHSTRSSNPRNNRRSSQQSRIFSLGMLIMQCITMLDSIINYYNIHKKCINMEKCYEDVEGVNNQVLKGMLKGMLEVDVGKRVRFKDLEKIVQGLGEDMFQNYLIID